MRHSMTELNFERFRYIHTKKIAVRDKCFSDLQNNFHLLGINIVRKKAEALFYSHGEEE